MNNNTVARRSGGDGPRACFVYEAAGHIARACPRRSGVFVNIETLVVGGGGLANRCPAGVARGAQAGQQRRQQQRQQRQQQRQQLGGGGGGGVEMDIDAVMAEIPAEDWIELSDSGGSGSNSSSAASRWTSTL